MGVDKSKWKKKLLKNRPEFRGSVIYKLNDETLVKQLSNKKQRRILINDGSIDFEEELKTCNSFFKRTDGDFLFNRLTKHIKPYMKKETVPVIVQIMDLHYRPPFKDIDTKRNYDKSSRIFKEVSDKKFPLVSHPRKKDISKLKRENKKFKKYKDQIKDLYVSIKENDLKIKNILEGSNVDVWVDGKGNPENRKKVYKYLTNKWRAFLKNELPVGQIFILEGAIVNHVDNFPYEYSCLQFIKTTKGILNETKFECRRQIGSQIGEGEQTIMFHINSLKKRGFNKFIVRSTDTDLITYIGKNWSLFQDGDIKNPKTNIILRCKNFYFRTKQYRRKYNKKETDENSNRIYIISFIRLSKSIIEMYPRMKDPLGVFFTFWGIFFGCDFISDVHKTIQRYHTSEKGDAETKRFLEFFFFTFLLRFKTNSFKIKNKDPLYSVSIVENSNFENKIYYNTHINSDLIIHLLKYYRSAHKIASFRKDDIKKLLTVCKNAEYVSNYMMNQFRIIKPDLRKYPFPPCTVKNKEGKSVFGYKIGENNKIVQDLESV